MLKTSLAALATAALACSAQAATVTQWTFNSVVADGNTATGSTAPATGTGTLATVGGTTQSIVSGVGSSDPAAADNSGLNITTFAAQGVGDKTRGIVFAVSTVGYESITLGYDSRHSDTASRYEQVQYSLDGVTFTDIALFSVDVGSAFFNGKTVDLSAIAGASNNASFAFRVVSTFAPGTSAYTPTTGTSYGTGGTWRFDMVTVGGNAISAVPEPGAPMMLLAGAGAVFVLSRRRRA